MLFFFFFIMNFFRTIILSWCFSYIKILKNTQIKLEGNGKDFEIQVQP